MVIFLHNLMFSILLRMLYPEAQMEALPHDSDNFVHPVQILPCFSDIHI